MTPRFARGQMVRATNCGLGDAPLTGMVIGEADWGAEFHVRLTGTMETEWFGVEELVAIGPAPGDGAPPEGAPAAAYTNNVIDLAAARMAGNA